MEFSYAPSSLHSPLTSRSHPSRLGPTVLCIKRPSPGRSYISFHRISAPAHLPVLSFTTVPCSEPELLSHSLAHLQSGLYISFSFKMRNIFSVMAVLLPAVSAFCDHGTTLFPRASGDAVKVANFGFDGIRGPLNWHGLNKTANSKCAKGKEQSPIDISTSSNKTVKGSSLRFNIDSYPDGAELLNLGSTLEVIANGSISLDNKTFKLAQFHFHTPSEHHLDGEYYPAEMHCVFQAEGMFFFFFLAELSPPSSLADKGPRRQNTNQDI